MMSGKSIAVIKRRGGNPVEITRWSNGKYSVEVYGFVEFMLTVSQWRKVAAAIFDHAEKRARRSR